MGQVIFPVRSENFVSGPDKGLSPGNVFPLFQGKTPEVFG